MEHIAPDILATARRFLWTTILLALTTLVMLGLISELIPDDKTYILLMFGMATATLYALAGRLFAESRPESRLPALVFEYAVSLGVIAAFQLRTFEFFLPFTLPAVVVFWLSVSAFTKIGASAERDDIQNRYWWFNHRAVTTAIIAAVGFLIISVGIFAIERSLSTLFGLDVSELFYRYILPTLGAFFAPFYWLSTIPRLDEYREGELDEPDFLSRAIGFLGQFVLVPLLAVYALILFAYAVQIIVMRSFPQGTLGWMVLGFTVTGAVNWLLLHPPFMRTRLLVRLFRTYWFYATIVPIGLYAVAVWMRIDSFGLTPDRLLLIAGGLWAALLTLAFVSKRFADIRLIPALAIAILLVASVGPWNIIQGSLLNQNQRLRTALEMSGWTAAVPNVTWTAKMAEQAEGAVKYLLRHEGEELLNAIFSPLGVERSAWEEDTSELTRMLKLPPDPKKTSFYLVSPGEVEPVDIGATPIFIGSIYLYTNSPPVFGDWKLRLVGEGIQIWENDVQIETIDLSDWISSQDFEGSFITNPLLTFSVNERIFSIVVRSIAGSTTGEVPISSIDGLLFTNKVP